MRWQTCSLVTATVAVSLIGALAASPQPKPVLDFDFFVRRVEPMFLQKRAGHTRCYVCHVESNNAFRLEKIAPGANSWTDEQSRRNYEMASLLVNVGDPATSRLLLHPLAPEGGGDVFHSGGRQFSSRNDPAWKTLAAWVNGAKLGAEGR
jgi:hypothetical protein